MGYGMTRTDREETQFLIMVAGPSVSDQFEIQKEQIIGFGAGCPDFGGRWPIEGHVAPL